MVPMCRDDQSNQGRTGPGFNRCPEGRADSKESRAGSFIL